MTGAGALCLLHGTIRDFNGECHRCADEAERSYMASKIERDKAVSTTRRGTIVELRTVVVDRYERDGRVEFRFEGGQRYEGGSVRALELRIDVAASEGIEFKPGDDYDCRIILVPKGGRA